MTLRRTRDANRDTAAADRARRNLLRFMLQSPLLWAGTAARARLGPP